MAGMPIVSTLASSNGFTAGVSLDSQKYGGTAVEVIVNTTGAGLTYNVEYCLSPISSQGSSLNTWFSTGSSALSTNAYISYAFPIRGLRYNITAGTSNTSLTGTVAQSF